jgi:hypothetical protein
VLDWNVADRYVSWARLDRRTVVLVAGTQWSGYRLYVERYRRRDRRVMTCVMPLWSTAGPLFGRMGEGQFWAEQNVSILRALGPGDEVPILVG